MLVSASQAQSKSPPIPQEVYQYAQALRDLRASQAKTGIAAVFQKGMEASEALLQKAPDLESSFLEEFDEETLQTTKSLMEGFYLSTQEAIYAQVEVPFFQTLAQQHGTAEDFKFFKIYFRHGGNAWPVYIERQTDYSGCTLYGSLDLVKLYGEWKHYLQQAPSSYQKYATEAFENIKAELLESTCACGKRASVLKEFRAFVKAYPQSDLILPMRERLQAIEQKKSEMRFECLSG